MPQLRLSLVSHRGGPRSISGQVDKVVVGQVFPEYFGFPCQFSFHLLLHIHHYLSSGYRPLGQIVADVPSGLTLSPLHDIEETISLNAGKIGVYCIFPVLTIVRL
jgi:hypothetical protein